jgi:hypothetical protein
MRLTLIARNNPQPNPDYGTSNFQPPIEELGYLPELYVE